MSKRNRIYNPKPTIDDVCIVCGKPYAHLHEVYGGTNRRNSQLYGLQVRLCQYHHLEWEHSPHQDPKGAFNMNLKNTYKIKFIDEHGEDEWYRIFVRGK